MRIVGRMVLDRVVDNVFAETEQVAFCTQNLVPGIDHSNDPLLQGRNFSYLDTQLKRLGSTNFTQLPINAPKCPMHHFQRDGQMQTHVPQGRANYEPNSWGNAGGPRENPKTGFHSYAEPLTGSKTRARSATFADHYSQAAQFYHSQTPIEQGHLAKAIVFELSKVETASIRERIVAHLLNIDETLAKTVAQGLGIADLPDALPAAMPPRHDLKPSASLSIINNGLGSFKGRKLGVLVSDEADAELLAALQKASKALEANVEIIAPTIAGVTDSKGKTLAAQQKIDGAPSVLYDAVVLLVAAAAATPLAKQPAVKDFINDAFAHCKFIAYSPDAQALLQAAGIANSLDAGCVALGSAADIDAFLTQCGQLRFWEREAQLG